MILTLILAWGPMIWTIQAELFPSRYRAKGMALSTASNWLWNFVSPVHPLKARL